LPPPWRRDQPGALEKSKSRRLGWPWFFATPTFWFRLWELNHSKKSGCPRPGAIFSPSVRADFPPNPFINNLSVPGAKLSVCHGVGGMFAASGTIIFTNER